MDLQLKSKKKLLNPKIVGIEFLDPICQKMGRLKSTAFDEINILLIKSRMHAE